MTPEQFDGCFKEAHHYWKRAERVKEWDEYKRHYYRELGQFPQAVLTEALGRCMTTCQYFPDIREIHNEMRNVSTSKTESPLAGQLDTYRYEMAERELDALFGQRFDGYTKRDLPAPYPAFIRDAFEKGRVAAERSGGDAQQMARNLLFYWCADPRRHP